jgi:hypothetical protein
MVHHLLVSYVLQRGSKLTTITRSPSSIYQPNWIFGYHTHSTLGVWLEVQIRLFKPVCQLDPTFERAMKLTLRCSGHVVLGSEMLTM